MTCAKQVKNELVISKNILTYYYYKKFSEEIV